MYCILSITSYEHMKALSQGLFRFADRTSAITEAL